MNRNARIPALLLAADAEQAEGHELKLEIDGYSVTTVYSPAEALAQVEAQPPLVVFAAAPWLAQEMVRLAGREPALAGVPVIALAQGSGRAILLRPVLVAEAS